MKRCKACEGQREEKLMHAVQGPGVVMAALLHHPRTLVNRGDHLCAACFLHLEAR